MTSIIEYLYLIKAISDTL